MELRELLQTIDLKFPFSRISTYLLIIVGMFFSLQSCNKDTLDTNSPELSYKAGQLLKSSEPFTGILKQYIPANGETSLTEYDNGWEHGKSITRSIDGQVVAIRYYNNGNKEGIHETFYLDGTKKTRSEFKEGRYINERWEWHQNGNPYIYEKFDDRGNTQVSKIWRESGQIYMNFVNSEGKNVGLPSSKVCDPINDKNER
ncbi:toxin-antitoxin system YwqK family antitoxin [Leptospira sp. GIMC2001]|uniref:toxin-antitoxin system YwqK family antitoxin n=1 Tax=Leptospira sp. GIMC2001 TaxID=1513297 RepID=UPI002349509B|nr:hypothetical protein [Leptospira sp. GIMC2001]WCL49970.1 hypothetical protein O4O04_03890 [Leptospira sp. GIMC2001]